MEDYTIDGLVLKGSLDVYEVIDMLQKYWIPHLLCFKNIEYLIWKSSEFFYHYKQLLLGVRRLWMIIANDCRCWFEYDTISSHPDCPKSNVMERRSHPVVTAWEQFQTSDRFSQSACLEMWVQPHLEVVSRSFSWWTDKS